jgi:hypothetical protein
MTTRWFFTRVGDVIEMRARFEADDGTIGDAFQEVRRGERAYGLTYQELFAAGAARGGTVQRAPMIFIIWCCNSIHWRCV